MQSTSKREGEGEFEEGAGRLWPRRLEAVVIIKGNSHSRNAPLVREAQLGRTLERGPSIPRVLGLILCSAHYWHGGFEQVPCFTPSYLISEMELVLILTL